MNRNFAEYATSTAFLIQLSKGQCNALLRLSDLIDAEEWDNRRQLVTVQTLRPLDSRGFVWWKRDEKGQAVKFMGLTTAGNLMVALLKEAGLTVENTNPISMLNRLDRQGAK